MLYDFGLGGVGQYNAPGLTQVPAPTPAPSLAPFPLPPALARPPAPMQSTNPYEMEQVRLINEQRRLVDQSGQIAPPQIKYTPPMNPLAAALIAFGTGTLATGGNSAQAIGAGGKAGLETYLGLKNQEQEKINQASQANYANQMNRLKAVMGGLSEIGKSYGELSKDQAERAKAAALIGADVYSNQIKQDYYNAQNAMEASRVPYLNDAAAAQAGLMRFNADPNNPSNQAAQLTVKNQLARDKFEGEFSQQYNAALANAGRMSDRQLELAARRLYQLSPGAKAAASSFDPKENSQYLFNDLLTTLRIARDEALGVVPSAPKEDKPKESKGWFSWLSDGKSSDNPMKATGLTLPGSSPIVTYP